MYWRHGIMARAKSHSAMILRHHAPISAMSDLLTATT